MIRERTWINQKHLEWMFGKEKWPGVADICRMEILLEYGGFIPGADSVCLRPIDSLFENEMQSFVQAYASYENERVREGLLTPILAAQPDSYTVHTAIMALYDTHEVGEPWKTTGNQLITDLARKNGWCGDMLHVWPSHYLIPDHYTGDVYDGPDAPYARHMWGSTTGSYPTKLS